jgi:ABC-2 type transport system ATP-binding protein
MERLADDVLRARGLTKSFRGRRAVDGVDLSVAPGEAVALLGPNGAGKTTTLLMLLGAISPDGGTVEIAGHRLPAGRSQAMSRVGFSAGYLPLPERLRVGELLRLYADLYGVPDPRNAVAAGMERFGVAHLARTYCVELSSGQRTLVGIVKATVHRPWLLVLDEPTASLDPEAALRVRTVLQELAAERSPDERLAMLVTTHNMAEVEQLSRRVVFLSAGRVVAEGTPADMARRFGGADMEGVFLHLARRGASE